MRQPAASQLKTPRTLRLAAAFAVALLLFAAGAAAYWPSESRRPRAATSAASDLVATPHPEPAIGEAFARTWQRTDAPVLDGTATRTWMWGPAALEDDRWEDYAESPGGSRAVRYYDKSRMEVTDPAGDQGSPWYVTNGLLVVELISGRLQTGEHRFEQRDPARLNIAGDAGPGNGPTYASMAALLTAPARADGEPIIQRLDSDGAVTDDPALEAQAVTAAQRVTMPGIDHQIASPFWTFMQSSGPIRQGDTIVQGPLFENPYYATGLPITEAYWATVNVGNVPRDVLLQCFERRCLTWTPDNDEGWRVESGNVGRHYYEWRYDATPAPVPTPTAEPVETPTTVTPTETAAPAATATATATGSTAPAPIAIGPGAVDAWMRSVVRDAQDRLWIVAMNNNAATAGTGPGELRVYRATTPGVPTAFEHVDAALIAATGNGTVPFADAALDGQNRLHVAWVDRGAAGQPLLYRVLDLGTGAWLESATTIDNTNLAGYGGLAGQGGVSIALGFDGQPRVAYTVAGFQNHIRTKGLLTSGWGPASDPLQVSGAWVWHPALALAPNGVWHLAAYDATNRTILATRDTGSGWAASQVVAGDVLGPENIDQSPALLVTPAGTPILTYLDGNSQIRVSQFSGDAWSDLPLGGDYHTHAPGMGVFANGTLAIAGHNQGSPPTALNVVTGQPGNWGAWGALAQIRADGSEVFRWAGAFSTPSADVIDLIFFDEDTNDDNTFDDQTLYYIAVPR